MTAAWIALAITGWAAVALMVVAVFAGRVDRNLADVDPPPLRPLPSLGERFFAGWEAADAERPFSVGDETDVAQALDLVNRPRPRAVRR